MELLWLVHTDTTHQLVEDSPSQVRRYLTATQDFDMLTAWDRKQLKDKHSDGGER